MASQGSLQRPAAAARSLLEASILFWIQKLKSPYLKTYDYICNIIFWLVGSQVGLQQPPTSCSCRQKPPGGFYIIFDPKIKIAILKNLWLHMQHHFMDGGLPGWSPASCSCCQKPPGGFYIIFDPKIEITILKNLWLHMQHHFLVSGLPGWSPAASSVLQLLPEASRRLLYYFWFKNWNRHPKKPMITYATSFFG